MKRLWQNRAFAAAFGGSLATVLAFDLLWCLCTSFKGLGFAQTYLYAAILALLMALPSLLWRRRWPMAAVLVVADLLAAANLMYCRTYLAPIPPASYFLGGNVAQFGDAILSSLRWYDLVFPLITVAALLLAGRGRKDPDRRGNLPGYCILLGALCLVAGVLALFTRTPFAHIEKLKQDCYYHATPPVVYTLPVSLLHDALESAAPVSEADRHRAVEWLEHGKSIPGGADSLRYRPRNIVFIIVESLEAWPLNATVEGRPITPNLNRLTADTATTWVARRVLSQVGPGRSIDGQLLMTAGLRPMDDQVYSMLYASQPYPHLSRVFKAAGGDRAYILSGDRATTWNEGAVAVSFGIDDRRFRESWDNSESFGRPRVPSDGSLLRQIAGKMRQGEIWPHGEKAFVEVITYSGHFPFNIPAEFRSIDLKDKYPEHLDEYITAVNYTDAAIGHFVDYILSRPDADSTMIVIAGDHEALGAMRPEMRGFSARTAALVDAEPYVPLIILNAPVPGRRQAVMGQVDVYPTVLAQAGLYPSAPDSDPLDAAVFRGLGISALSPLSPPYATDITGKVYGDTTGADPAILSRVLAAPRVSRTLIQAAMPR